MHPAISLLHVLTRIPLTLPASPASLPLPQVPGMSAEMYTAAIRCGPHHVP